jgi:hypothetical protein
MTSDDSELSLLAIQQYLSHYAYRDQILDPPDLLSDIKTDILFDFNLLNIRSKTYSLSPLAFFENIIESFAKLRDVHTLFSPACLSSILHILPYSFTITATEDNNGEYSYVTKAVLTDLEAIVDAWESDPDKVDLSDKEITFITWYDSDAVPHRNVPLLSISEWANLYSPASKTPAARLNYALSDSFHSRSARIFSQPPGGIITVEYIDPVSQVGGSVHLPFYVIFNSLETTFEECGKRGEEERGERGRGRGNEEKEKEKKPLRERLEELERKRLEEFEKLLHPSPLKSTQHHPPPPPAPHPPPDR